MGSRTTIVIAHHLSTVKRADEIAVMESGRVVAQGSHDTLCHTSPLYRRYWSLQSEPSKKRHEAPVSGG